jgi:ABC-2 type transport system ATP-binding protein
MITAISSSKPGAKLDECLVKCKGLEKTYRNGTRALNNVNIEVSKGELFGLIGADGAGKTTTLKILAGVMEPTKGEAIVLGNAPRDSRKNISYLTQHFSLYSDLTVYENLEYEAGLRDIAQDIFVQRADRYLKELGLIKFSDRLAGQLSGGMKQKLSLCCCLISQPRLLLLDEPSNGLDPLSRRELWQHLFSVTHEGISIIVATPYMDEAELCTRVALIQDGSIHEVGSPQELKDELGMKRLEILVDDTERAQKALDGTTEQAGIVDVYTFGDRVDVVVKDAQRAEREIRQRLATQELNPSAIQVKSLTLDNVFSYRLRERGITEATLAPFPRSNHAPGEDLHSEGTKYAIHAELLSKSFQDFQAVRKVDLKVHYGEIYGLLGANGSGKTTTIKMLCGLQHPSSGSVTIAEENGNLRSPLLRKRMGYMSQKFTLYDALTVLENLKFYAAIYDIPHQLRKGKIDWVIEACGLTGKESELVGPLPRGWKQRIAFGASIMHEPEILFLDEPTAGVDPIARRQIWSMIRDLAHSGTAVMVTTHYLEEAEYCNTLGFLADGTMVTQGSPHDIKRAQRGSILEVVTDNPHKSYGALVTIFERWQISLAGNVIHVFVEKPEAESSRIHSKLRNSGISVRSLQIVSASLEDAFVSIVSNMKPRGQVDEQHLRTSA